MLGLLTLLFQLKFESWESNPIPSMSSQIVRSASRAARSLLSASKNSRFYSGKFLTFYFICTFESFDSQCFDRSLRNDSTILFFFDIYYIIQRKCWILCLLLLENRSYWPLIIRSFEKCSNFLQKGELYLLQRQLHSVGSCLILFQVLGGLVPQLHLDHGSREPLQFLLQVTCVVHVSSLQFYSEKFETLCISAQAFYMFLI